MDTFFQGRVPAVSDCTEYIVFETELEAQREIADHAITRLQEFLDSEHDFDDATAIEECVVAVSVSADGIITDEYGNCFSIHVE